MPAYGLEDQREHHADQGVDVDIMPGVPTTVAAAGSLRKLAADHYRSPPFQIKSIEGPHLCIASTELSVMNVLTVERCDNNSTAVDWTTDKSGRIHTVTDDSLCIKNGGGTIKIGHCFPISSWKNLFAFNAFFDTINSRKNGRKTVGIRDSNEPLEGKTLYYSKGPLALNTWSIDPPDLFVSKADIPSEFQIKSTLTSMCITSSKRDENPRLVECDATKNHQIWSVNNSNTIGTSRTAGRQCLFKGKYALLRTGRGGCGGKKAHFMYDAFTSSIIHQRGGDWAFTVDVGLNEVVLSVQDASKSELQEWELVAV